MHIFPSLHTETSDDDSAAGTSLRQFIRFFFFSSLRLGLLFQCCPCQRWMCQTYDTSSIWKSGNNLPDVISIPLTTGIEETTPNCKNLIAIRRALLRFLKLLLLMCFYFSVNMQSLFKTFPLSKSMFSSFALILL